MSVTFGTVQLLPAPPVIAPASDAGPAPAAGPQAAPADPRDLAPVLRHLHARAARVRAH